MLIGDCICLSDFYQTIIDFAFHVERGILRVSYQDIMD